MARAIPCPSCHSSVAVPADHEGGSVTCPGCGAPVPVPRAESAASPPVEEAITVEPVDDVAVARRAEPAPVTRRPPPRRGPTCPECGKEVPPRAHKCPSCRAPLFEEDEDDYEDRRDRGSGPRLEAVPEVRRPPGGSSDVDHLGQLLRPGPVFARPLPRLRLRLQRPHGAVELLAGVLLHPGAGGGARRRRGRTRPLDLVRHRRRAALSPRLIGLPGQRRRLGLRPERRVVR